MGFGLAAWQESVGSRARTGWFSGIPEKRADVQKGHIGGMVAITVYKVNIGSVVQGEILEVRRLSQRNHKKCKRKYWRGGSQKKGWKSSVSLRY